MADPIAFAHFPGLGIAFDAEFFSSVFTYLIGPVVVAFLIGSIPFGVIVGRVFFGIDLRKSGSGKICAANALRSYGTGGGAAVLVLDVFKGLVPVLLGYAFFGDWIGFGIAPYVGAAAVLGHCYSPWLRGRGGKGVATWLGALFGISWPAALAFIAVWLIVVIPTRYAALGSIVASLLTPFFLWLTLRTPGLLESPSRWVAPCAVAAFVALVIVWKHRENIVRLREGRENKISFSNSS